MASRCIFQPVYLCPHVTVHSMKYTVFLLVPVIAFNEKLHFTLPILFFNISRSVIPSSAHSPRQPWALGFLKTNWPNRRDKQAIQLSWGTKKIGWSFCCWASVHSNESWGGEGVVGTTGIDWMHTAYNL